MAEVTAQNAADVARAVRAGYDPGECAATVRRSATLSTYAKAMARPPRAMKNPAKEAVNPHFKTRYADLPGVLEAVMPALLDNGFAVQQFPCEVGDAPALLTLVVHESGEWVETVVRLRPAKPDPQGVGSAITYMRRYSLLSIAGVAADDDDDGNAASRPPAAKAPNTLYEPAAEPIRKAASRDARTGIYRQVEADRKAGRLTTDDEAGLLAAFKAAAAKIPQQPAGAKP